MSLIVAGSVAIDNVKTPDAEASQLLGGSASYAALAAAFFHQPTTLLGVIGKDFPQEHLQLLQSKGVDLSGVERAEGDSFTWTGEYFEDLNTRVTHHVAVNVLENWNPKVPQSSLNAEYVVLANMSPENQLQTLQQIHSPSFVVGDTMDLWISIAQDGLKKVLPRLDLFVLNDGEARLLTGHKNLVEAGAILKSLGPRHVVIKLGEHGAMLFGDQEQLFRTPAHPLRSVADPTGAGDSFLGGLTGYLASINAAKPNFNQLKQAVVHGTVMASFTCEAFSTRRLEAISSQDFDRRFADFRDLTAY